MPADLRAIPNHIDPDAAPLQRRPAGGRDRWSRPTTPDRGARRAVVVNSAACDPSLGCRPMRSGRRSSLRQRSGGPGLDFLEVGLQVLHDRPECLRGLGVRVLEHEWLALIAPDYDPDRKSTRLNSSHLGISYAVFC